MTAISFRSNSVHEGRTSRSKIARSPIRWALALVLPLGLLACDGAEEREAAYFERGKALYEEGKFRKASLELRNARQINPLNVEALFYLGLIAEKENDFRGAYKSFQAVIEQKDSHVGANLHAGRILLMSGDVEGATARADKALEVDPDNIEARALRGALLLRNDELEPARRDAVFALEKDPGNVAATSVLVGVLRKEDKVSEAIELLKKTTAANKDEAALRLLLVELYRRDKNVDGIKQVYGELFEAFPRNYRYRTDLARYLVAFDKKDEAEKVLRAAVEAMPDDQNPKLVLIDFLANQRSFEQAEAALKDFIAKGPANDDLKFGLAQLYIRHSKPKEAEATLRSIEENTKDKTTVVRARAALARMQLGAGDQKGARALVDQVIAEDPGNASALITKARLQLGEGKRDEAIADLRHVLRDNPGNAEALRLISQAHLSGGDLDLAAENLRLLLTSDPQNDEARMTLARIYARQRNHDGAVDLVDQVLERQPRLPAALRLREEILLTQGKLGPAMETAKRMIEIEGQESRGYVGIGRANQFDGRHVEALEAFRRAYVEDDTSVLALTGIVQSHLALKQPDEAILLLSKVVKKTPENAYAHNMLGEVYAQKNMPDNAEPAYLEAIRLRKDWTLPYLNLGRLKMAANKPEEAVAVLTGGIENNPEDATLRLTLASVQQSAKNFDDAMKTYRGLLAINPKMDVAANNLAALLADYEYDDPKAVDEALSLAQRFQNSDNPFFLDTLGWVHYRKGDYSLAVVFITKALENRPEHPQINFHLGMAHFKAGNSADARRYLEKAIALGDSGGGGEFVAEANAILKTL